VTAVRWPRPAALPDPGARRVVVEASAGTGKTYFLEHRLADLVIAAGATLDQVLVVTFTEKATRELRARIRDLLDRMARAADDVAAPDEPAWVIDDAARARIADAALAFDRAPIHTIHAFCQRVLIEDAFAGRRLFDQTQIPDEAAFDDAFYAVLRSRFAVTADDLPALRAWLRAGKSVEALRVLLLDCLRADAPIAPAFAPVSLAAAIAEARAALTAAGPAETWVAGLDLHHSTKRSIAGWIAAVVAGFDATGGDPFADVAALDDAREKLAKLAEKTLPALARARPPALVALGAALGRALDACVPFEAAIAAHLLPPVLERIGVDKRERGQFDYQDMLKVVHEVLCDPERGPVLAARLRRRHPWALIDEFQDTDPVQWDIFHRVWNAAADGPDPGGLMIVGDPKQAIYGFRGADVHTYLRACRELRDAGAAEVVLDVNRRSSAALVDAVNRLLVPGLGQDPFFTGGITYDHPVRAAGDVDAAALGEPIRVLEAAATNGDAAPVAPDGRPGRPDLRTDAPATPSQALLAAMGDEIEQLIDGDHVWHRRGERRVIGPGDVMVLTRSNGEAAEAADALRARGLPCTLLQAERLFAQLEACDLADVLDAVAAPRDRSRRLRAWSTAFFAVPWDALAALGDAPDDHPLVEPLFAWSALAQRRDYERLFARLLDDTRYAERALLAPGGERAIANTQQLIELLLREVARARGEVHELVRRLRGWIADGKMDRPDDRDVQRIETDVDAIQVMTIHRAKGLEAAVVFVFGGTGTPPSRAVATFHDDRTQGRAAAVGKLEGPLKDKVRAGEAAENQRLAYVAMTRAQVRLYLPHYPKVAERQMYRPIQDAIDRTRQRRDTAGFAAESIGGGAGRAPADAGALAELVVPPLPAAPPAVPSLGGLRAGRAVVSYTRLAHDTAASGTTALDPADFDRDEAAPAITPPPDHLPGGAATGLFVHEVLELVDVESAADDVDPEVWAARPEVAEVFAAAARHHAIAPRHLPHARAIVHATLTRELDLGDGRVLPPLHRATHRAREIDFAYELPGARGRGFVRGVIDLIVKWDDRLWIADYKTDLLPPALAPAALRKAAAQKVADRYEVQARLYGLAAAKLVPRARIGGLLYWFVRDQVVIARPCDGDALADWGRWLERVEVQP
jgi:exodeoxyribonuclease V beta subunit